jgi:hypothetical protein
VNRYEVNTNPSKVLLSVLILLGCLKSNLRWQIMTLGISMTYGNLSSFCETLCKYILTNDPWNMTSVTRNMLETELVSWTSNPILSLFACQTKNILWRLV